MSTRMISKELSARSRTQNEHVRKCAKKRAEARRNWIRRVPNGNSKRGRYMEMHISTWSTSMWGIWAALYFTRTAYLFAHGPKRAYMHHYYSSSAPRWKIICPYIFVPRSNVWRQGLITSSTKKRAETYLRNWWKTIVVTHWVRSVYHRTNYLTWLRKCKQVVKLTHFGALFTKPTSNRSRKHTASRIRKRCYTKYAKKRANVKRQFWICTLSCDNNKRRFVCLYPCTKVCHISDPMGL